MNTNSDYIYYAHHLYKYNTKIEEYEINLINKILPQYTIINPNGNIRFEDLSNEEIIMKQCLNAITEVNTKALVFSSINGVIGKGVYDEINCAINLSKSIYYINNNTLEKCNNITFKIINESRRIFAIVLL